MLQVATLCTKIIRIQVSRVDPIYCNMFGPAERVRYMTCRLIGDISKKGGQHYFLLKTKILAPLFLVQLVSPYNEVLHQFADIYSRGSIKPILKNCCQFRLESKFAESQVLCSFIWPEQTTLSLTWQ